MFRSGYQVLSTQPAAMGISGRRAEAPQGGTREGPAARSSGRSWGAAGWGRRGSAAARNAPGAGLGSLCWAQTRRPAVSSARVRRGQGRGHWATHHHSQHPATGRVPLRTALAARGSQLAAEEGETLNKRRSKKIQKKCDERKRKALWRRRPEGSARAACLPGKPGRCHLADGSPEGKEHSRVPSEDKQGPAR